MKLQDCTHGKIVCMKDRNNSVYKVGMIVGITTRYTLNPCPDSLLPENAVPLVQWSGQFNPVGVDPSNLYEFKDSML